MNTINNINNNCNINFTARMNVSKIKNDRERWDRISKEVEAKTENAPDVKVYMYELNDNTMLACIDAADPYTDMSANFGKRNSSKILKMPEEKIVDIFKKLINIANTESQIYQKSTKFLNDLDENINSESYNESDIWSPICDIVRQNTAEAIDRDPILKKLKIRH